jgi:hypothetical protein
VADKSSQLVLDALSRAVGDPGGLPLFSQKASPGLFAATTLARQVAERCKEQDLLRVVRTEARGKAVQEVVAITAKGLDLLLSQQKPRQVLEDLVRALEGREKQLGELVAAARQAQASIDALKCVATTLLERVQDTTPACAAPAEVATGGLDGRILTIVRGWQATHAAKDCPLPDVFGALRTETDHVTLGAFHDAVRHLHEQQAIYLHPWTGPLYDLPEPPLALLIGHEIAYYASLRA